MPESRLEGLGGSALFGSFNILMSLQAWPLSPSVLLMLAFAEGCSLGSPCFSVSEKLPIREDLSATWPARKERRRAFSWEHPRDFVSVVLVLKICRRINWSKYISREAGKGEICRPRRYLLSSRGEGSSSCS